MHLYLYEMSRNPDSYQTLSHFTITDIYSNLRLCVDESCKIHRSLSNLTYVLSNPPRRAVLLK